MIRHPSLALVRRPRRGAAFLMLVVVLLLVIVGVSESWVRGELTVRRGQRDRSQQRSLQAAIDSVQEIAKNDSASATEVVLPLDPTQDERIEISTDRDRQTITARWLRGEKLVDQRTQTIDP